MNNKNVDNLIRALELIKNYGETANKKSYILELNDIYYLTQIKNSIEFILKNF